MNPSVTAESQTRGLSGDVVSFDSVALLIDIPMNVMQLLYSPSSWESAVFGETVTGKNIEAALSL